MSIVVFWLDNNCAKSESFLDSQLMSALKLCETNRNSGFSHVTISSEMSDSSGRAGVDSVENKKLPDGSNYTWTKRR